ncbi:MAG: hypothetical protein V8S24_02760 [Gordonibacter pamelaeae]
MMPGFASTRSGPFAGMSSQFIEIGSMLYNMGGRGKVRNTDHGTLEIVMNFPAPFTVMEAAIVRVGAERFALPSRSSGSRGITRSASSAAATRRGRPATWTETARASRC